jgi:hypothetical protein
LKGLSHPARGILDAEEAIAAVIESTAAGELGVERIGFDEVHAGIMDANGGKLVALPAVSLSAYQTVTTVGACQFVTIKCNQARDIPDLVPGKALLRQQKASPKSSPCDSQPDPLTNASSLEGETKCPEKTALISHFPPGLLVSFGQTSHPDSLL